MFKIIRKKRTKARKDYVCYACGGKIGKGQYYTSVTALNNGKMATYKTHEDCNMVSAKPIEEQPKAKTEEEFVHQIHDDLMYRLQSFDFQTNLQISLTPIILQCLAWEYAMEARNACAAMGISETRKAAVFLKKQFGEFDRRLSRDLRKGSYDVLHREAKKFKNQCIRDFAVTFYSAKMFLQKNFPHIQYFDMRANALMSMVLIKTFWKHCEWSDALLTKKFGKPSKYDEPEMHALYKAMKAFACPGELVFDDNLNNAVGVLFNRTKQIEFCVDVDKT